MSTAPLLLPDWKRQITFSSSGLDLVILVRKIDVNEDQKQIMGESEKFGILKDLSNQGRPMLLSSFLS